MLESLTNNNDTFGHAAGDAVLKQLAEILRWTSRADEVFRYEEFVAILTNAPSENCGADCRTASRAGH